MCLTIGCAKKKEIWRRCVRSHGTQMGEYAMRNKSCECLRCTIRNYKRISNLLHGQIACHISIRHLSGAYGENVNWFFRCCFLRSKDRMLIQCSQYAVKHIEAAWIMPKICSHSICWTIRFEIWTVWTANLFVLTSWQKINYCSSWHVLQQNSMAK